MSAVAETVIVRRDAHGVVLRYYPDRLGPHHTERKRHPSDRERMDLLRAERACLTILIIGEMVLSDIAMTRLLDELHAIQRALNLKRPKLGMAPAEGEAV
jgi:hypothetical protein